MLGGKARVVADQDAALGLFRANDVARDGVRHFANVFEGEILGDDAAPAVGAEFDGVFRERRFALLRQGSLLATETQRHRDKEGGGPEDAEIRPQGRRERESKGWKESSGLVRPSMIVPNDLREGEPLLAGANMQVGVLGAGGAECGLAARRGGRYRRELRLLFPAGSSPCAPPPVCLRRLLCSRSHLHRSGRRGKFKYKDLRRFGSAGAG